MQPQDDLDFNVPQQFNLDTASRGFTERQIFITAITAGIIGIIPSLLIKSDFGKIAVTCVSVGIGLAFARVQIDGMILLDYLRLRLLYSKKSKVYYD